MTDTNEITAFEALALYIDNSAPVLFRLLRNVREAVENNEDIAIRVRRYIKCLAASDMRIHGDKTDRENSKMIYRYSKSLTENEWKEIGQHYLNKHNEGERLEEYLK